MTSKTYIQLSKYFSDLTECPFQLYAFFSSYGRSISTSHIFPFSYGSIFPFSWRAHFNFKCIFQSSWKVHFNFIHFSILMEGPFQLYAFFSFHGKFIFNFMHFSIIFFLLRKGGGILTWICYIPSIIANFSGQYDYPLFYDRHSVTIQYRIHQGVTECQQWHRPVLQHKGGALQHVCHHETVQGSSGYSKDAHQHHQGQCYPLPMFLLSLYLTMVYTRGIPSCSNKKMK